MLLLLFLLGYGEPYRFAFAVLVLLSLLYLGLMGWGMQLLFHDENPNRVIGLLLILAIWLLPACSCYWLLAT
jgi:hypothetical protein